MTAITLLIIGVIVTWASAAALWQAVKLHLIGRRVSGALVDWRYTYHHQYLGNGRILLLRHFHPAVRFEASGGSPHDVVSDLAYDEVQNWPIGRPFGVRYDPANPREATIDPLAPTWMFPAVFLIAGVIMLWAAVRPLLSGH
ncbi:MAG: DUF3592 domain-containing protein [Rhodospirillales bacterium]|nr:DUF3592 domain-containing protein [Rhodospirillales bacterium]